ncbi:MAG: InlB B-repeat-containing protein, partial [Bacillota bacterium]|nr:InlB B-repeat-containing protein [Bacillota bacterium]
AKWIGDTYYITFVLNGNDRDPAYFVSTDSVVDEWIYKTSSTVRLPISSEIVRSHYTFDGWYRDPSFAYGTKVTDIYNTESADVTLYAKWNAITYHIVYTMSAGEFVSTYSEPTEWIYASYSVTLPIEGEIIRKNYHFDGWYENGDFTKASISIIDKHRGEDIRITARWIPNTYKIIYHMNNGRFVSTDSIIKEFTYNISDVPLYDRDVVRNNYQFRGWYDNSSFSGAPLSIVSKLNEGDVDLYAKWEPNVYNITYILNDGHFVGTESVITKWVYASDNVVLPASNSTTNGIERTDYHFDGWYDKEDFKGTKYEILSSYTEKDITLYAKWVENTYNIIYVNNGGHFEATSSVVKEWTYNISDAELPRDNNIKRDHWVFKGWYDNPMFDGTPYTIIHRERGGGDITLYAKWEGVIYNIEYVVNSGRFVEGYKEPRTWQYASTSVTLPASDSFVRDHYIFRGWYSASDYSGGEWTRVDKMQGEDLTLYAKWEAKVYSINYVMNEGQWVSTTSIVANYSSFEYDGGDVYLPIITQIKRTNYVFLGWYDNEGLTGTQLKEVSGTHPGDITVYAAWRGEEHFIHYEMNGGSWLGGYRPPTSWLYNFQDITLPTYKNIGQTEYSFNGWYDNPMFFGGAYSRVVKTRTMDITLYAKFEKIPDHDEPNPPAGGGGGGAGGPGKISAKAGIKEEVSRDALDSLNDTAIELVENNIVVKSAIDILPVSLLIVRDHAVEIKNATSNQQIYDIIAKGNADYPIQKVVAWDRKNDVAIDYDAIYDRVTNKFYKVNMANLPTGWIGVPNGANSFDWYYIKDDGKRVTEFLNI